MNTRLQVLLDLADQEFSGESFNGPSLIRTLELLTPEMAAYSATYEGYSAWSVALHVAYFKHFVAFAFDSSVGAYPLQKGPSGFGMPNDTGLSAWNELLAYLREVHAAGMRLFRAAEDPRLNEIMPRWKVPFVQAISWLCSHDTYHCAQIRNMGVPGLKEPREA